MKIFSKTIDKWNIMFYNYIKVRKVALDIAVVEQW